MDITIHKAIFRCLSLLQAPQNSIGFFQLAYALQLTIIDPTVLTAVTKQLYPLVAQHYKTNPTAVERNLRRTIHTIWEKAPTQFMSYTGTMFTQCPTCSQALASLSAVLAGQTPTA